MTPDPDSRERVRTRVMQAIYHIPITKPAVRWRRIIGWSVIGYVVLLIVMIPFRTEMAAVWQWFIATALVTTAEWGLTNRWSLVDMGAAIGAVIVAVWMTRTRRNSHG